MTSSSSSSITTTITQALADEEEAELSNMASSSSSSSSSSSVPASSSSHRLYKLTSEFAKLKTRSGVLEKQLTLERKVREQFEREAHEAHATIKQQEAQLETLQFNVQRLTKRCEKLMQKIKETTEEMHRRSLPTNSWMDSLFHGALSSASSSQANGGGSSKLSQQLKVTQEELRLKIAENEKLHIEAFELEREHKSTLETVQRKIEDLKQTLTAKERELTAALTVHNALLEERKHSEQSSQDRIQELVSQLHQIRSEMDDREETMNLINRQLDGELRSIQRRFGAKISFDDSLHDPYNALNLPPFDRPAMLARAALIYDFLLVCNKLKTHVSLLAKVLVTKLSIPIRSSIFPAGVNQLFGADTGAVSHQDAFEAQEQQRLALNLVTMPPELEGKFDELILVLHEVYIDLKRQANAERSPCHINNSLTPPAAGLLSISSLARFSLPDLRVAENTTTLAASSSLDFTLSSPLSTADFYTSPRSLSGSLTSDLFTSLPPVDAPNGDNSHTQNHFHNHTNNINTNTNNDVYIISDHKVPSLQSSPRLPFASLSSARTSEATASSALHAFSTMLETCRHLVLAELDVLEHQKHIESKNTSRIKQSGTSHIHSLSHLVSAYRELLNLLQTALGFVAEMAEIQSSTHQSFSFYCSWLFDLALLGGPKALPTFSAHQNGILHSGGSMDLSNGSLSSPSPSPLSPSPSNSSSSSSLSPAFLLSLRRSITTVSAQFAATVASFEQQGLPTAKPLKQLCGTLVSEATNVSKLVGQLSDRVLEYRRYLSSLSHNSVISNHVGVGAASTGGDGLLASLSGLSRSDSVDSHELAGAVGGATGSSKPLADGHSHSVESQSNGGGDAPLPSADSSDSVGDPPIGLLNHHSPNHRSLHSLRVPASLSRRNHRHNLDDDASDSVSQSTNAENRLNNGGGRIGGGALGTANSSSSGGISLNGAGSAGAAPFDLATNTKMLRTLHFRTFSYLSRLSLLDSSFSLGSGASVCSAPSSRPSTSRREHPRVLKSTPRIDQEATSTTNPSALSVAAMKATVIAS